MFATQKARRKAVGGHGSPAIGFAELRNRLANESSLNDVSRQRLLILAERLARVQALSGKYAGISLSPHATAALEQAVATV